MTPPPKILRKILRGYPLRPAATPQILDTVQYPSIPLQSGVQQVALDNSGPSRATPTNGPHPPSSRSLPDDQPPIDRVQDSGSTERILEGPVVSSPVEGEAEERHSLEQPLESTLNLDPLVTVPLTTGGNDTTASQEGTTAVTPEVDRMNQDGTHGRMAQSMRLLGVSVGYVWHMIGLYRIAMLLRRWSGVPQ